MDHMGCFHRNRTEKQARQVTTGRDRVEQITFRLATMDPFLEWHDWYAPFRTCYRLDRFILTPVNQASQSEPRGNVISSFFGFLMQQKTTTERSSIAPVACFCSPAKSCSYVPISLTRTHFSTIPQREHSDPVSFSEN